MYLMYIVSRVSYITSTLWNGGANLECRHMYKEISMSLCKNGHPTSTETLFHHLLNRV